MTPREGQKKAFQESNQRIVLPQAHAATGESVPIFKALKGKKQTKTKQSKNQTNKTLYFLSQIQTFLGQELGTSGHSTCSTVLPWQGLVLLNKGTLHLASNQLLLKKQSSHFSPNFDQQLSCVLGSSSGTHLSPLPFIPTLLATLTPVLWIPLVPL